MELQLTKDGDKMICLIYKTYLTRRKGGLTKARAKDFSNPEKWETSLFNNWDKNDIHDTLVELKRAGLIKLYVRSGFVLQDNAIIYMENRFPGGLSQVLDWIGKIKAVLPFV